jgi:hypothetical protein
MPHLLDRHRQTTMTQQFGYADEEGEEGKGGSDDESLPPNWGRVQDPATGRIIFRHSQTKEIVLKKKDLYKKAHARKNPPNAAIVPTDATPPLKKRKVVKTEPDLVVTPDQTQSSFVPPFITPTSGGHADGGTNGDPIELLDSEDSSVGGGANDEEELSELSDASEEDEQASLPKTDEFEFVRTFKDPGSGSDVSDDEDDDDESKTLV